LKIISHCLGLRNSKLGRLPNFLRSVQKYNFPERILTENPTKGAEMALPEGSGSGKL
jgi:hypothetical protein